MSHPWCKPFDAFEMQCFDIQVEAVLFDQRFKMLNGF